MAISSHSTWGRICADYSRNAMVGRSPAEGPVGLLRTITTARYGSVFLFRLSQGMGRRVPLIGSFLKQLNQVLHGSDLAWQAQIGPGLVLFHPNGVVVGPYVSMGSNCSIQQGVTIGGDGSYAGGRDSSPVIGERVEFGAGAKVFGRIRIGDDVIIGANAVVVRDVPPDCVAVGIPATFRPRSDRGSGGD